MIDHLRGRLAGGGKDFVVVECAGMGVRVHVSSLTRADLPPAGGGGDAAPFTRVTGIGKKLAQRIASELPDRLKRVSVELTPVPAEEGSPASSEPEGEGAPAPRA